MVGLLKPQNGRITRDQIFPKNIFLKNFAVALSPRPILSFGTIFYNIVDRVRQPFSKFRHFRKILQKVGKCTNTQSMNTQNPILFKILFFISFVSLFQDKYIRFFPRSTYHSILRHQNDVRI